MTLPLSEQMRPKTFEEVVGQDHLLEPEGFFQKIIERKTPLSLLLWGPPGCGKTTIARLYAQSFNLPFHSFSAVSQSLASIKEILASAQKAPLFHQKLLFFIDEIHRFNKAQQDLFLPYLESGSMILVGATTENPSFVLNNALLSRLRVIELNPLTSTALSSLMDRIPSLDILPKARSKLIELSQGDGRHLMNLLENLTTLYQGEIDLKHIEKAAQKRPAHYDRSDEAHYNLISALHKTIRGSDPDAAIYYLARMLQGGEDPQYILRRLVRLASEDIGLADPQALQHTLAAWDAFTKLGSPEGDLIIAQAVIYLALAPKSNALYTAYKAAEQHASTTSHLSPPKTILNSPTKLMKELGYGEGYRYDHDMPHSFSGQEYFPEGFSRQEYYDPRECGFEREMAKRLRYFKTLRSQTQT